MAAQKIPEVKVGDLVLDRYRVVEQIGSGGHSVVFRGTDERLSRPVCIKVFSGLGGQSGVGRTSYEHFVQEAFALSRLTHPNTLRIYDFGHLGPKDAAGMPLQVCEYMNGGTLSQIIREKGKQPLEETVRIVSAMCAALAEAHTLGIVHRDIKPQNILFGSVGSLKLPKLADFGIAKWSADTDADREQRAEDTAIVAGQKLAMYSPSWAAPEQLAGQPVSAATDIYSLAVVAIYMLTGKAIFADEDVYAGYKKRRHADELVRETLLPFNLPRGLIGVLARALAFDPKKRLLRVDELATELQHVLEPSTEEVASLPAPPKRNESEIVTPTSPVGMVTPPAGTPAVRNAQQIAAQKSGQMPAMPTANPATIDPQTPPAVMPAAAPTPPAIPPMDPTPQTFHAPATKAWMSSAPQPTGATRRLALADVPQPVSDRRVHFVMVSTGMADLVGPQGIKVRLTLIPGPGGQRVVHVKGLTCFIAYLGGRPSPAVSLNQSSDLALVTPRAQEIGHLRVVQGATEGALVVFPIGNERVGVGLDDCADPILFDFGPGSDAYFVYTQGRTVPRSGRRG
ncbi:MAG TPA: serine/threonine-protein kinase [Kofleriaceae bacterium]|nr:serine/threonine-protein kinase [Kofleriaceae bacterium]